MRWHLPSLLAAVTVALLAADASATVMLRATLEELAKESDLVLRAEVVSTEGLPTSDGKRIFTRVVLAAGEAYKGTPPPKVVVHVPGGSYGGYGQLVHGAPRFEVGEEVVVFLVKQAGSGDGTIYRVNGMAQGKLSVVKGPEGELAVQRLEGLELTPAPGAPAGKAPDVTLTLPALRAKIGAAAP